MPERRTSIGRARNSRMLGEIVTSNEPIPAIPAAPDLQQLRTQLAGLDLKDPGAIARALIMLSSETGLTTTIETEAIIAFQEGNRARIELVTLRDIVQEYKTQTIRAFAAAAREGSDDPTKCIVLNQGEVTRIVEPVRGIKRKPTAILSAWYWQGDRISNDEVIPLVQCVSDILRPVVRRSVLFS